MSSAQQALPGIHKRKRAATRQRDQIRRVVGSRRIRAYRVIVALSRWPLRASWRSGPATGVREAKRFEQKLPHGSLLSSGCLASDD